MTRTRGFLIAVSTVLALDAAPIEGQLAWTNVTGNLAYKVSECGNMSLVSAVPGSPAILAGIAARDLWVNTAGTTWSRMSDVARSERIVNRATSIVYDPKDPLIFWESGIYNYVGLYKTTDGGKTFARLGGIDHNDSLSVDFGDPERRTMLASGHEQEQTVYRSTDSGRTWKNIGRTLVANSGFAKHVVVIDALTYLVNTWHFSRGPFTGIYRTTDGGDSWTRVSTHAPLGPPLRLANGVIYWAAAERLLRSADHGATWDVLSVPGLRPLNLIELPGGGMAAVGASTIVISRDNWLTWKPYGSPLPYAPDGIIYSAERQAFFIWRADCKELVLPNAIMKLDAVIE